MTLQLKLNSREDSLLYSLLIYYILKQRQISFVPFSLKALRRKKTLITFPKGPFAHKKSKEQYFASEVALLIALSIPLRLTSLLLKKVNCLFARAPLRIKILYF